MTPKQKVQVKKIGNAHFKRWRSKRSRKPKLNEPTHQDIEAATKLYLKKGGKITQEKVPEMLTGGPVPSGVDNFLLGM